MSQRGRNIYAGEGPAPRGQARPVNPCRRAAILARRRRRQRQKRLRRLLAAVIVLLVIALALFFVLRRPAEDAAPVAAAAAPSVTAEAQPTPEPTSTPRSDVANPAYAALRPEAREGCLPVFRSIETDEKVIAITVDDCYQAENLRTIIDLALANDAKLTLFPIGEQAMRAPQQAALKYAWENGMELENHTFTHNGLYNCSDEELAAEVYRQNLALSQLLGVEYQCHFLRPMGGDARNDQRIHAYIRQLGYYGIAHWSESGTRSLGKLPGILAPGQVYLFHTTDEDVERLSYFIPYAVSEGYRLVTLNELFGYPENETAPLEKEISQYEIPALEPYEKVYVTYSDGSYAYGVKEVQEKLIALGYLSGGADGIYGGNTAKAVAKYQSDRGLEATGKADPETQLRLFGENAAGTAELAN